MTGNKKLPMEGVASRSVNLCYFFVYISFEQYTMVAKIRIQNPVNDVIWTFYKKWLTSFRR